MSDREANLDAYRRWGYLAADLEWLGRLEPAPHPELAAAGEGVEEGRAAYCGTIAVEFMHIPDPARRRWIQERMEGEPPGVDRRALADQLMHAALFEQRLQTGYLGNKRFSIEGIETLIPLLNRMLDALAEQSAEMAVLAMSHRGRLSVMAHVVGNDVAELLSGFEDVAPRSVMGAGDVKYHRGSTGVRETASGKSIRLHLVSNPSHLEAVNPVMMGRTRAKQDRLGGPDAWKRVVPILMHGDAAFAGQGITAETLNLAEIDGFGVGGTLHVIVNNLIGFTAEPPALHSSRFASDVARRLPIPIFHVNAEDPEAAVRAAQFAADYRSEFASDVVVDLIGFRRHGHSEIDDPTLTQPKLYAKIRERPPIWETYVDSLDVERELVEELAAEVRADLQGAKDRAAEITEIPPLRQLPDYWSDFIGGDYRADYEVATGIDLDEIAALADALGAVPESVSVHPKAQRLLDQRREMAAGDRPIDFGMAELLAYGSLVRQGVPVRISGQDSRRGTFSHRHFVLFDTETGEGYSPLQHLGDDQAPFQIYDSALSEAAVLGYEYGYSRDYPEALVAWEAQFGDFANGAQVIFDQFVCAGEDKWGLLSGVVALLPHGYEGQGPEHSSARIERFLQLAAEDAILVVQPSTAAQHFHLLRRQALRRWRKPLIVFTPKSMLRNPAATSSLEAFTRERFLNVIPEREIEEAGRVLVCSGKLVHELRAERAKRGDTRTAIVTLEQLYPFPRVELAAELDRFPDASILWVQEEPANMGALFFVGPRIEQAAHGRHLRTIKRSASASPATGSAKAHAIEQQTLIELAFN